MTEHDIFQLFQMVADTPLLFAVLIIATTFILEDLAITVSAVIASQADIHFMVPLSALFVGIVLGDVGLYYMGKYGGRFKRIQKYKESPKMQTASALLEGNLFAAICISRCIPGMRLPTYMLIGGLDISFTRFIKIILAAVLLWTVTIFTLFYTLGDVTQHLPLHLKLGITGGGIALFIAMQFFINTLISNKK